MGMETLPAKPLHQVAAHFSFAAEQMRAAGDVEKQSIRRIESDQRRITVAPVGDRVQQSCIGGLVRIDYRKRGIHRARIGERHAGAQAELGRFIIQRCDLARGFHRRRDRERFADQFRRRVSPLPRDAVRRQTP